MATNYEQARQELDAILAGLMTEKNMKQNDKLIISNNAAAKLRSQDPIWLEKQRQRNLEVTSRPEWREKTASRNRELAKNKEWIKWRAEQMKAYANSEEGKAQRSEQQKKNWENNYESMAKALKDRYEDGKLSKKISESLKNSAACKANGKRNKKPMMTPDGPFPSRVEAAAFYKKDKSVMNGRMKKYPDQYYYITQEEYIMLTGKDPFNE